MIRRLVLAAVAGVLVLAGSMAPAAAAGELGLSSDGVTWGPTLPGPLFDPAFTWVPGDSEQASFFVRNQSADAAVLNVTLLTGPVEDLINSGDLTISAQLDGGPFTGALTAGSHLLLDNLPVDAGTVHEVTVKIDFDPQSANPTQSQRLDFRFDVTLSQDASVLPPTDGGDGDGGDGGGGLPDTGTVVSPFMLLFAVLLCAAGAGLVGYSRRRYTALEERPSHVQA
ncbi:LPXTG cell wall anchor domain-containing protein [Nocardioides marmoriginsengisoli]|uniref:LPXTG cell wall anchor domain-containing protein n=1 Tax=Nocardioides marmoriginsengisoli TaxID=661483 RepID=A0A3N0CML5_9ACTN|nr:LPXTG cell wall anchor domain-containing protein [Nocardioides marmoriginsengisoli]RNL64143.1 LPXTG cell wall anchor domain-containing protein [Nocardioides marmoriginsengisoli]